MQIPILIEAIEGGRCRVRSGEPFALIAEGASCAEATHALERLIAERLARGVRLGWLKVPNGIAPAPSLPLPEDDLYKTDPSFAEWQRLMAEFRHAEDDEEERQLRELTNT